MRNDMKRICLFVLLAGMMQLSVCAQKGLHTNEVFENVKKNEVVQTIVKGRQLSKYKLTYFRSIKFKASEEEHKHIEELVREDMENACDLEMGIHDNLNGALDYAIMILPPEIADKTSTNGHEELYYLCYQCVKKDELSYAITLVFMKGTATMKELSKTFKREEK